MTYSINTPEMLALIGWLREVRIANGLSMRELGKRLQKPHTYVQKVETGERRLDVVEFIWYCRALRASPHHGIEVVVANLVV